MAFYVYFEYVIFFKNKSILSVNFLIKKEEKEEKQDKVESKLKTNKNKIIKYLNKIKKFIKN